VTNANISSMTIHTSRIILEKVIQFLQDTMSEKFIMRPT